MEESTILPSSIEIKYDCIKIDGVYVSTVTIIKYETNIEMIETIKSLMGEDETEVSFHIKRENNFEMLKKLTNLIAESGSEIGSVSKNQMDINILDNIRQRALELRRKIQIDNEQIYALSTYLVVKASNIEELINKQKRYINMLYAKQIIAKPSNFRQKEAYLATLPVIVNNPSISKHTHGIFTQRAMAKLFPFFTSDVLDENGILLGKTNSNLCAIDIFSSKNNNYNMCIFGSSGAGKSYFVKLMIVRNSYKGIRQIVIDPEGEYTDLIMSLGGTVYDIENYNPFEINESLLNTHDFFNKKVEQIVDYVAYITNISDKEKLRKCVEIAYSKHGITNNKESLYRLNDNTKMYIKPQYIAHFPNMKDLFVIMKQEGLKVTTSSKYNCFNNNPNNDAELYCFNLKGKNIKDLAKEMKIFVPKIYELIKSNTLIYFDEVWKCIGFGQDRYVIENIYNMFKTLRKNKAGIVTISQDICDLFALDDGSFGKSILNNANIKVLFKMEWQDIEMFERMLQSVNIGKRIKTLSRGNAHVEIGNTSFNLEVQANEYEHILIEGGNYEKDIDSNE